jgi:hypothetical protein
MALAPRCTECGGSLEGKPAGTKTDSVACRSKRARRLKRQHKEAGAMKLREGMHEVSSVVTAGAKDAAHEVMKEELRPLVREAMTEQVLLGIGNLVQVTPRAIELLTRDMESADETIAQRAYTLLLKYTLGNPSVAPPPTHAAPAGLTVVLGLPRPGDETSPEVQQPSEAVELRQCQDCREEKPVDEFIAGSERCSSCFDGMRGLLKDRFGEAYSG